ncbi:MAG: cell wall associated biofilm protein [Bacteroidetes bacterium]|nr:MAG: cell wall associated biofilm protein [Bacteroidota bacterium]
MKSFFVRLFFLAALFSAGQILKAQAPAPQIIVYGTSPFVDSLWGFDTASWTPVVSLSPSIVGDSIEGILSITFDPQTFRTYGIAKVTSLSTRALVTVDLATGVCTVIGELGDKFSTLSFRSDGQLFGVTGDGANTPETLYLVDKITGVPTLASALGNGADGELICFSPHSQAFFHWSGNDTVVFEKFAPAAPYTVTPITIGPPNTEIFGAAYLSPNQFLGTTLDNEFVYLDTLGNASAGFAPTQDNIRGLSMPPVFTFSNDTVCAGTETFYVGAGCLSLFNGVHYFWGDGNFDITGANGFSHIYITPGTYTVSILLTNGALPADTFTTYTVTVIGCVGMEEQPVSGLQVYPNPGTGLITLDVPVPGANIEVSDVLGKIIYRETNLPEGRNTIDLESRPEGIYFVKLLSGESIAVARVIISR